MWRQVVLAVSFAVVALAGAVGLAASDWTYERAAVWDSTHRNMFRAPACAAERCEVQGRTYALATLIGLHHATAAYVLGLAATLPISPTTGSFYTEEEAAYLGDLRSRWLTLLASAVVALVVATVAAARAPGLSRSLALASAVTGGFGLALLAALRAAPEAATLVLRNVASPSGVFAVQYNIHQLYPADFGVRLGVQVAITLLAVALVTAVAGLALSRRG